ncbi:peptidase family U32-domain-containing protein [Dunaliella salina]|uniref:Peptidase family U32-domain-containing protein n=1 Tax=Dunaliella salina TaxID=3046 RepID=A0ABQ7FXI6_DUNSA|nr:peptidase family U32-domain-containing protein [Dunaliella salina]|eukprot:KAF5827037.1 peptidase family U32-domain-containing protein [Dunaliella salina]
MKGSLHSKQSASCQLRQASSNCGFPQIRQGTWLACTPRNKLSSPHTLIAQPSPCWTACSAMRTTGTYNTEEEGPAAGATGAASPARLRAQKGGAHKENSYLPLVKPEILAPAGGWPQVKAACENGADAVYFGTPDFNARARASNFEASELRELMTYLHARGVKGYVALNILIFDEELEALEQRIREVAAAGVDALIVQDLGAVELIRRVAPGLPIHGSTQMSITSAQGAQFAAGLGVERIVVGRELSIKDIAKVREQSTAEVEAFVHGALCVSYSGQCFSSEAWGGRSANRGQCAQACRLPYGLIVDGMLDHLQGISYLKCSTQGLTALSSYERRFFTQAWSWTTWSSRFA